MEKRITVRALVLRGDELLVVKHTRWRDATRKDAWCLPGGRVEDGELITDAITREMTEETGVTPDVRHIAYVHQYTSVGYDNIEFFFYIANADDYAAVDLSKSTHGQSELAAIEFKNPHTIHIMPEFLRTNDINAHVLSTAPPLIIRG
jgi:ADP-ribose pyrophosphatase YjhB (NUDIX family)